MSVAGRKNKPKSALLRMLQSTYGKEFHPIMELAKLANSDCDDVEMKFKVNKELAQYVTPKLRHVESEIELAGSINHSIEVSFRGSGDS